MEKKTHKNYENENLGEDWVYMRLWIKNGSINQKNIFFLMTLMTLIMTLNDLRVI
jgi:hypothetical protein